MTFDLTADPVEIAMVLTGTEVTTADFVVVEWVRAAPVEQAQPLFRLSTAYRYTKITATVLTASDTKETDSAWIRVLVGPAGVVAPARGKNDVWAHIGDSPEDLYLLVGKLSVT
ncbi:MAG: hypothetical protein ACRDQA_17690 [Nocardioidaceae bacterium]